MQRILNFSFVAMLSLLGAAIVNPGSVLAQDDRFEESYKLGPGDLILIDVFGEEDLSMEVMLDDTGVINYPFLGELVVKGHSVSELERLLLSGLKGPYLIDPDITVSIKQYRSVYLTGEVQDPGGFPYQPGLTVEKAIALAGGFTERASRRKIDIKRGDNPDTDTVRVRLSDPVRPGDIITVQKSFF